MFSVARAAVPRSPARSAPGFWTRWLLLVAIAVRAIYPTSSDAQAPSVTRTQVVAREGTSLRAALSPDGSRVAMILLGSVYVVDRATGETRALTDPATDPNMYLGVAWSPDGTHLALQRGYWPPALTVVDVTTKREDTITVRGFASDDITWHRRTGVLVLTERGDSTDVMSYPVTQDGFSSTLVTLERAARGIALSPDGMDLAYVTQTNAAYLPTAASQVAIVHLATRATRQLGDAGGFDAFPTWSPDGASIAFVSRRGGSSRLWVMERDGRNAHAITSPEDSVEYSPPSWTPEGSSIIFVSRGRLREIPVDAGPSEEVPFAATFTVAHWSGLRRPVIPGPGTRQRAQGIVDPALSPDGRSVAFGALGDLWIAPIEAGIPRRLVNTPHRFEWGPRWSRDAKRVSYFAMDAAKDPVLHVLTLATGRDTAFVLPALPDAVAWSLDGRVIAVAAGNRIGLIDAETGAVEMSGAQPGFVSSLAGWNGTSDSVVYSMIGARDSTLATEAPLFARMRAAADATGSEWAPLVTVEVENSAWTWDLSRAAYTRAGDGYWTDSRTRTRTRIADPVPTHFSWSEDGTRLGYLSGGRYRVLDLRSGRAVTAAIAPEFTIPPAPPSVLIRAVRVIDGTGRPPTEPKDVVLRDGRIASISDVGTVGSQPGMQVIDGAGKVLLPGLIDMHAHMDGASIAGPSPGFLYYGVLTARDLGSPGARAVAMRERALLGAIVSPRLFTSTGTVSSAWGHVGTTDNSWNVAVSDDTASIRRAVQALSDGGADVLKFYDFNFGFQARVSAAAHAIGMRVTAHRTPLGAAYQGMEGHEHSQSFWGNEWTSPWRADLIGIAKAADICVTPTLVLYTRRLLGPASPFPTAHTEFSGSPFLPAFSKRQAAAERNRPLSPARREEWERAFRSDMASMLRLRQEGVRVVTGTDMGPEGRSLHWEMALLVMAGFTPLEAIRAATFDAASCLGVDDSLGSVAEGKVADLILVAGDPSKRIEDAMNVEMVFLGGRPVSRPELLELVRP